MKKKNWVKRIILITLVLVVAAAAVSTYIMVFKSFSAEDTALEALAQSGGVTVTRYKDKIVFSPENPRAGLVFYGGARVECEAYAPLMREFASRGFLCVLIDAPFNFAIFALNAPEGIAADYPEIDSWYLGGHSLGGIVASMYLADNTDEYNGIILLASYPYKDLSDTDITLISVYGGNDGVVTYDNIASAKGYWPENAYEIIIDGGNHSGYGYYGEQPADNEAAITKEEQISITASKCADIIFSR